MELDEIEATETGPTKDPAVDADGYLRMSTTSSLSDYTPMSPNSPNPSSPPLATLDEDFEMGILSRQETRTPRATYRIARNSMLKIHTLVCEFINIWGLNLIVTCIA